MISSLLVFFHTPSHIFFFFAAILLAVFAIGLVVALVMRRKHSTLDLEAQHVETKMVVSSFHVPAFAIHDFDDTSSIIPLSYDASSIDYSPRIPEYKVVDPALDDIDVKFNSSTNSCSIIAKPEKAITGTRSIGMPRIRNPHPLRRLGLHPPVWNSLVPRLSASTRTTTPCVDLSASIGSFRCADAARATLVSKEDSSATTTTKIPDHPSRDTSAKSIPHRKSRSIAVCMEKVQSEVLGSITNTLRPHGRSLSDSDGLIRKGKENVRKKGLGRCRPLTVGCAPVSGE